MTTTDTRSEQHRQPPLQPTYAPESRYSPANDEWFCGMPVEHRAAGQVIDFANLSVCGICLARIWTGERVSMWG